MIFTWPQMGQLMNDTLRKVRAPKTEAMTALSVSFTSCFCLTHPDRCSSNYHLNTTSDGELTTTKRFVHRSMVQNVRFFP